MSEDFNTALRHFFPLWVDEEPEEFTESLQRDDGDVEVMHEQS